MIYVEKYLIKLLTNVIKQSQYILIYIVKARFFSWVFNGVSKGWVFSRWKKWNLGDKKATDSVKEVYM